MKLCIEDTGRDGDTEIAVEKDGEINIHPYTRHDLTKSDRLRASFWKAHGYVGRLEITDSDLQTSYVVNVK
jgi:hypothetical protein